MTESIKELNLPMGEPVELVVLGVKKAAMNCKVLASGDPVTFRKVRDEVEGEIITVRPSKLWRFQNIHYMTGEVESRRIDIEALDLKPLGLTNMGPWNPGDQYWGEPGEPIDEYLKPVIDYGPRLSYEMEQIIPFQDPEDPDSDPISDAADYHEMGDHQEALKRIHKILTSDLRCLDAHSHLGSWLFNMSKEPHECNIDKAKRHFEVGVKIGELSLSAEQEFDSVLPWGHINNRPYLRCLHGYGLALWRLGKPVEAREIFDRMLWLNPPDNQGVRFLLAGIDDGKTWNDIIRSEDKS
jgi:tetratricopeptide (TPR) repeat protein